MYYNAFSKSSEFPLDKILCRLSTEYKYRFVILLPMFQQPWSTMVGQKQCLQFRCYIVHIDTF